MSGERIRQTKKPGIGPVNRTENNADHSVSTSMVGINIYTYTPPDTKRLLHGCSSTGGVQDSDRLPPVG